MPVLLKLLSITSGEVLEIGTGIYSTPLLHWYCFANGRKLVSVENDEKYLPYAQYFEQAGHEIATDIPSTGEFDIVFIDSFPHENREAVARQFADRAKYIVIHDYDGRELYHNDFKYSYHYCKAHPETIVLSNLVDLSNLGKIV